MTLLANTSWFQFQVFRSFIQTELIRKNLWNHHLECKKNLCFYKWMLHTFYPPHTKKKTVQIWHQNSPLSPNHREIFQCFETWHLFLGIIIPSNASPAPHPSVGWSDELWFLQRTWKAQVVESTKAIDEAALNSIWFGRYYWVELENSSTISPFPSKKKGGRVRRGDSPLKRSCSRGNLVTESLSPSELIQTWNLSLQGKWNWWNCKSISFNIQVVANV